MSDSEPPAATPAEPKAMFDLAESEGVTESERILTQLCRNSFLRLWSQTNVFTNEGFKDGKGSTKELCDALVVFGNDIIVFSDKHVAFQIDKELAVAWSRWYRRAVRDSCKQLHGAKSWLQRSGRYCHYPYAGLLAIPDMSASGVRPASVVERFCS